MKIHVVRQGDTLVDLTQKYNVPLERILEVNPDMNEETEVLTTGTKVRIPTGKISLQRNNSKNREFPEEKSEPIFKEPSPHVVEATAPEANQVHAEEELTYDTAPEENNAGDFSQPPSSPMPNEYGHTWSYYGNYFPAVSYYPGPEFIPQPNYPISQVPSYVPPYYHATSPVPVAHTNAYYPDPMGYVSAGYPGGCVPCFPCYEGPSHRGYSYNEEPWKR